MTTGDKAHLALLKVQERALQIGAIVSLPAAEGKRYDAVIDWSGRLYRAQVKYADGKVGSASSGSVAVSIRSVSRDRKVHSTYYTKEEIDVLLVYLPAIDRIVWLGPEIFHGRRNLSIRYVPSRNSQTAGCLFADSHLW